MTSDDLVKTIKDIQHNFDLLFAQVDVLKQCINTLIVQNALDNPDPGHVIDAVHSSVISGCRGSKFDDGLESSEKRQRMELEANRQFSELHAVLQNHMIKNAQRK